jgi:hypothetical protein
MKTFRCSSCGGIAFFDDTVCIACGHRLAFAPDRRYGEDPLRRPGSPFGTQRRGGWRTGVT